MNKDFFKLGIIGNPLSHSISPAMQNIALNSVGFKGSYEKFEITLDEIEKTIEYFKANDFTGFNVTIPYKIEIMKYLDEIDENANKIGAVNTVKIQNNKLTGYNTDIYGFVNSIPQNKRNIKNAKVLGCGGAALAVIFGLESLGCQNITICARNKEKAETFIKNISQKTNINFNIELLNEVKTLENADILVNATPLGTAGENENKTAISESIIKTSNTNMFVFDLVYNPQKTKLLQIAENQNLQYTNGLNMLILQGARAFEIWTDKFPDIEKIKQEL